jgi:uncharacterized protein YndB with AHSA1/START domain
MSATSMETRALSYELDLPVAAPRDAVWTALVDETNAWWLPDFHMLGTDSVVSFDFRAGGQLIESTPAGASLLWYTVVMCAPGETLHLVGHIAPEWGGPATSMLKLHLVERDGGTVLTLTDALFGNVTEGSAAAQEEGWLALFGDGLKNHVEAA